MDFQQTLDDLYGLQLFGIKLGLANTRKLLATLGNPQNSFACVHVAGTNGKGSVSAFLAEILRQAGLSTGLYTSPHLHCFTERIRVDGQPVDRDFVCELAAEVLSAARPLQATFFEVATAMALLAFQRRGVKVAVLETGLGGRLDATNVVTPVLSLITPVSLDHQEHLGDDLQEIAAEKGGIIKPGVPVVIGRQHSDVNRVLCDIAADRGAPVCLEGRDYRREDGAAGQTVSLRGAQVNGLASSLNGAHQLDNMAQAVAAGLLLAESGWPVSAEVCRRACASVVWPGRLEWWEGPPKVLLDASHNAAGIATLAAYLEQQRLRDMPVLVGLSRGRRPAQVLKSLAGIARDVYAVPVAVGDSVDPGEVVAWAKAHKLAATGYQTLEDGLAAGLAGCSEDRPLVVCGSLFLVAAVREKLFELRSPAGSAGVAEVAAGILS